MMDGFPNWIRNINTTSAAVNGQCGSSSMSYTHRHAIFIKCVHWIALLWNVINAKYDKYHIISQSCRNCISLLIYLWTDMEKREEGLRQKSFCAKPWRCSVRPGKKKQTEARRREEEERRDFAPSAAPVWPREAFNSLSVPHTWTDALREVSIPKTNTDRLCPCRGASLTLLIKN